MNSRWPITAWRYIEQEYAHSATTLGCLRIGTLNSYAALEGELADPLDGRVERRLGAPIRIGARGTDTDARLLAASMGFNVTGEHIIISGEGRARVAGPPLYCMCLSDTPNNKYLIDQGRVAVLEISDLPKFAAAIAKASPRFNGRFWISAVSYEPRRVIAKLPPEPPDPFKKEPKFAPEREVRIIWQPSHDTPEPFNVISFELVNLVRLL
jgi:hypothetical protein